MKEEKVKFKTTKKDEVKYLAKSGAMFIGFVILLATFDIVWRSFMITLGGTIRGDSAMTNLVFTSLITAICVGFAGVIFYGWWHKIVANHVGRKEVYKMMDTVIEKADELDTKNNELELAIKILQQENGQLAQDVQDATANFDSVLSRYKALELDYETYRKIHGGSLELAEGEVHRPHIDDWALDQFVKALAYKLAVKRQSAGGWNECDVETLFDELLYQINETTTENMDMVDIANYAMFIWARKNVPAQCAAAIEDPHAEFDKLP